MAVKINPMRLTGMASGFDTDAIIKSLMQIEQLKLDRQLRSRTTLTWKQDAVSAVQSQVSAFRNKYISLLSSDNIMSSSTYNAYKSVVGGDPSAVSVRTTASAKPGTITISRIESVASGASAKSANVSLTNYVPADNNVKLGDMKFEGGDYEYRGGYGVGGLFGEGLKANGEYDIQGNYVGASLKYEVRNGKLTTNNGLFGYGDDYISFSINGVGFSFNRDTTLQQMLDKVNNSSAGVTMSYDRLTDGFKIETKDQNADAKLTIVNGAGNAFGSVYAKAQQKAADVIKIGSASYECATDGTAYILDSAGNRGAALTRDATGRYKNGSSYVFAKVGTDYYELNTNGSPKNGSEASYAISSGSVNPTERTLRLDGVGWFHLGDDGTVYEATDNDTVWTALGQDITAEGVSRYYRNKEDGSKEYLFSPSASDPSAWNLDTVFYKLTSEGYYVQPSASKIAASNITVRNENVWTGGTNSQMIYERVDTANKVNSGAFRIYETEQVTSFVGGNDVNGNGKVDKGDRVTFVNGTNALPQRKTKDSEGITQGTSAVFWVGGTWVGGVHTGGVKVTKDSNEFEADGIYYTLNHATDTAVTISVTRDATEPIAKIKAFVDAYNELVKSLRTTTSEKKTTEERKYGALTDDEKAGMSDKEIELWETTAKKGLLYHDSSIEKMLRDLRSSLFTAVSDTGLSPASIGLRTSLYGDLGTIELDEAKLRSALEADPERVMKMFTGVAETKNKDGSARSASEIFADNGLLNRMSNIFAQYNGTATGTTLANLKTTLDNTNKRIEEMEKAMAKKEESLYLKYAKMEEQLSKLNSQSDWLSGVVAQMNASKK